MTKFKDLFRRKKPTEGGRGPEYQYRDIFPVLRSPRPRALTIPLPPNASKFKVPRQRTNSQAASLLLRLPLELRLRIYETVLGYHKVHVAFEFGPDRTGGQDERLEWRWRHSICTRNGTAETVQPYPNCFHNGCLRTPAMGNRKQVKLDLALLWSCRKVYSEAIHVLYSTTTFNFASHELLRSFPSLILPQRFAAITSIDQTWTFLSLGVPGSSAEVKKIYSEMWEMLARMPCLIHLKIAVAAWTCAEPPPDGLQETFLGPLEKFKGKRMKTLEIWVVKSYAQHFKVAADSHFKLCVAADVPHSILDNDNGGPAFLTTSWSLDF